MKIPWLLVGAMVTSARAESTQMQLADWLAQRPAVLAAEAKLSRSQVAERMAAQAWYPEPSVSYENGYEWTSPYDDKKVYPREKLTLRLDQPIWDSGQASMSFRMATIEIDRAKQALQAVRQDEQYALLQLWTKVQFGQRQLKLARELEQLLQAQLQQVQEQGQAGHHQPELLQQLQSLVLKKAVSIAAESGQQQRHDRQLHQLLGDSYAAIVSGYQLQLPTELPQLGVESLVQAHPLVQRAQLAVYHSECDYEKTWQGHLPKLNLVVEHKQLRNDQNVAGRKVSDRVMLELNYAISTGGKEYLQRQQVMSDIAEHSAELSTVKQQKLDELNDIQQQLRWQTQMITLQEKVLAHAKSRYELLVKTAQHGQHATVLEQLNAKVTWYEEQQQLVKLQQQQLESQYRYLYIAGVLSPDHIRLTVQ